jgi:hypothetical protein
MKVDSFYDCFDYSLSNKCLEHIYRRSEEAGSTFAFTQQFFTTNLHQTEILL